MRSPKIKVAWRNRLLGAYSSSTTKSSAIQGTLESLGALQAIRLKMFSTQKSFRLSWNTPLISICEVCTVPPVGTLAPDLCILWDYLGQLGTIIVWELIGVAWLPEVTISWSSACTCIMILHCSCTIVSCTNIVNVLGIMSQGTRPTLYCYFCSMC